MSPLSQIFWRSGGDRAANEKTAEELVETRHLGSVYEGLQ